MKQENLKNKIREIATYHSDDETSGYLLSEDQIERICDLVDERVEEILVFVKKYDNKIKEATRDL